MRESKAAPPPARLRATSWQAARRWDSRRERPALLLPSPGTRVGEFLLEAELGRGGYGTVYRARRDGLLYALKLVPLHTAEAWDELQLLTRLRLGGVVRLHSHGQWPEDRPQYLFLALEYVQGRPLDTWAREENPSARQVTAKLLRLSRTLQAVHHAGVVHRDIKPANVLVRAVDAEPVLVDFGAGSDLRTPHFTASVLPPGTAPYRTPEAWRFYQEHLGTPGPGYPPSPADDLWALGVVLYWLLTDTLPFDGLDDSELVQAILHHSPPSPHVLNPRVPRALGSLCMRLLEKAPPARFPDAGALAAALERALAGADAAWDLPLCPPSEEATPRPPGCEQERWLWRWCHERPPRGLAPLPVPGLP